MSFKGVDDKRNHPVLISACVDMKTFFNWLKS